MSLFHEFYYLGKYIRMADSHVGEYLAVECYTTSIHRVDECRIVHPIETSCIVQTDCPELTKLSLLEFARDICIGTCLHDSSLGTRVYISVHSTKPLRKSEDIFMSFVCHHTTFYASHISVKSEKLKVKSWTIRYRREVYRPYGRESRASS